MEPGQNEPIDYQQPVAYDAQGRPLYLHPAAGSQESSNTTNPRQAPQAVSNQPGSNSNPPASTQSASQASAQPVNQTNESAYPMTTPMGEDPADIERKRQLSTEEHPRVHLDDDEYIILKVPRSFMGVAAPVGGGIFLAIIVVAGIFIYPDLQETSEIALPSVVKVIFPALLFLALDGLFIYIAVWIYYRNRLFVSNKCAIGYIQQSLFDREIQKASLDRIENISSHQAGLLQTLFNYGSIHMSTIGDESNYRLNFVENPRRQAEIINDVVSKHKEHSAQASHWRNP